MADTRPPTVPELSRRVAVETPEHVLLEFELAGIGSRSAAAIYDGLILFALILLVSAAVTVAGVLPRMSAALALSVLALASFAILWGYFLLFEGLRGGRTPGKLRMGIRVVMDTGHPISFQAAAIRNLVRLVDLQPGGAPLLGLFFIFFHRQNKRLGDIVAGTMVVRDEPEEIAVSNAAPPESTTLDIGKPVLSDDEFALLARLVERMDALEQPVRRRFCDELADRFASRFPERDPRSEVFLVQLYELEENRRQSTMSKGESDSRARGVAHRFVARRRQAWGAFRTKIAHLQPRGIGVLNGEQLVHFAGEYREIAADLARARTYGVDPRVIESLDRIVAMGHQMIYGLHHVRRASWREIILTQLPAAVVQARAYVLIALILFAIPGIAGYSLIRERPNLAPQIMPSEMIARAEAGEQRLAEGIGYGETPSTYLPLVASSIVANNVQVAFGAFAFGITAGVGTVIVLVFNGLFFGAVLGMFANYGLEGWILTFVAGHGVLELTAIFIAGGAGLLVARALVAPGDMVRRDALVIQGRLAIRMLGAAVCLLLLAGTIEGFLSASDAPTAVKLGVSAASAVLLALYIESGRRANSTVRSWDDTSHIRT
jgi:uncharacterized RDD family membrane protein YckC/uncharacterized membrane protein SpoIIM required for sporulation